MGNKAGRQKSQEQGEGEDDANKLTVNTLNNMDDQSAEKQEAATKTANEQTEEGDDKDTKKDEKDRSKPTEDTTTVNKKDEEQISGEVQKNLVEQEDSGLKEQAAVKGDTSASETKMGLTEKKHIDSREKDEEHKIDVSSKNTKEKMSEEKKVSYEEKEQSDSVAEGIKDKVPNAEEGHNIAFEQGKVDDGQLELAVQEEQQVAESTKKSEAVPQQEETISKEIPPEEASSEQKEQPESCGEVRKDEVLKVDEGHAEASEQVKFEADQLQPEVQEQEQAAESIKKSETVPQQEEFFYQEASSEEKEQLESFGEVGKDEFMKADERHTETTEQVKVEDDQPEPEVQEQEQVAESTKKSETVPHQEENVSNEIPAEETSSEQKKQPEPFGKVSKDDVLKAVEGHTEASEQVKGEDDQPEPSTKESEYVHQKEEKVSEDIFAKEEATHAHEEHTMVANTIEEEKAEEASTENADTKPDKVGRKEEDEYAEEGKVEGIADPDREQKGHE